VDGLPVQYFLVNQRIRGWSLVTREQLAWQAKFYENFTRGIGSAKAFGFGLLVIAPIS
jgi:hypothetical protein